MKPKVFSGYLSSIFYAGLLSVALPLSAEEAKGVEIHLSEVELQEIFNNPKRSYVYIGKEVSGIADVMAELSKLDDNPASLIHGLVTHIEKGFNIGNYDAVAQALEEAELLLMKHADALGEEKASELTNALDAIIEQVIEEKLNLDAELLSFLKDSVVEDDATKSGCCKPKPHCHGLRLLVIKEKVDFQGKVKFREDVRFRDDVTFEDDVVFQDSVTIEGPLTLLAGTVDCDLTVGCNINMNNSTSATVGNIFKGAARFMSNFGTQNTFVGSSSGNFTMAGANNSGFGASVLPVNAAGSNNVGAGAFALELNTDGSDNIAVGIAALSSNTTGNANVAVGSNVLSQNTIGSGNIGIGSGAGSALTTGNDNIYLANAGAAVESDTIRIGNIQSRFFVAGVRGIATGIVDAIPVLIDSLGQMGTTSSSQTVKHDIEDMGSASDNVMNLRPVTFVYNADASNTTQYGLIAEEVEQVFPALVARDAEGNVYSVHYETLPTLLLNELQKLAARVAALEGRQK